ncbi:MAG: amidohydrolase family protein [Acidobacteriia bacterium]|nr:amidohydrolase family protein [Terriglobia bacterium]
MPASTSIPRAELHTHLGGAVDPPILWSIAHRQGIRLPTKDYWEFEAMVTMAARDHNRNLNEMNERFYKWTELIQSSPEAIQESVASVIGGGYRKCNLVLQELRFNPMFRNRGGERDLDHIINAALWGLERATMEYPTVKAGLILMMDRRLTREQNAIIVQKASKYQGKGVIGVDLAGPDRRSFSMAEVAPLFQRAKDAGLGVTVHCGETGDLDEMRYVVRQIVPNRIGHGIAAVRDRRLMDKLAEAGTTLELCPTSNLKNRMVRDVRQLKRIITTLLAHGVRATINTDGPELYHTNVHKEEEFLTRIGAMSRQQVAQCIQWAFDASFIRR